MPALSQSSHIILLLLILPTLHSLPLQLSTGTKLRINSSYVSNAFELIVSAEGRIGESFKLFSEALSPVHGVHTFTMKQKNFDIVPEMDEETMIMNLVDKQNYYLAFNHPLKKQPKQTVFLPIQVIQQNKTHELLLPGFNIPMSFMAEGSFYTCENLLISVQTQDKKVQLNVFALEDKAKMWTINGKWDRKWRNANSGLHYGQALRNDGNVDIDISISNGFVCLLNEQTLKRNNMKMLDAKKYYKFDDLWKWGMRINGSKRQTLQDL